MKSVFRLLPAATLALLSLPALATSVVYTNSVAFLADVAPGQYTENFDGLLSPPSGPFGFSGGAFNYSASAPSDLYLEGGFLGAAKDNEALTITFAGGNVRAIGANFFATDFFDAFQSVSLTLTLSDGTVETFTPGTQTDSYRGFISDIAITSLVISGPGADHYAGLDNLTVGGVPGGQVPEPAAWSLVGLALAGLLVTRRRAA